jgi:apolipoprotein N-acyltransferase
MNSIFLNPRQWASLVMKHATLAILTGLLFGTSYIPFPPWAILFCLVPLWSCWLREKSLSSIFWTGWIAQFVFNLVGFNWVAYTIHEFGHFPWPAAVLVLFAFCGIANLFIPLVGVLWRLFCEKLQLQDDSRIWALVLFTAVGERTFPMIFKWNFGYPWLWGGFPAVQLTDIFGFAGLSTLTLVLNGLMLQAWWRRHQRQRWWPFALASLGLFATLNLWGHFHGQGQGGGDRQLRFLLVQGNIGNDEKLMAEQGPAFRDTVINRFGNLTLEGLHSEGPADFAVWPETAFPELIETPTLSFGYPLKLKNLILASHTKLITGGYSRLRKTGQITNSFFVLGDNGEWLAPPYHKTILLAFGEYLPGGEWFPSLYKWLPEVGNLGRGPGPTVLDAGGVKIGAQICYEGLFDWFARDLANAGAQVLVNITNDSWYDKWEEPNQHAYMTLAHAIEVRRPLVRSTNTGISTVALASGEIMTLSPVHQEWFHRFEVPYSSEPQITIFMRWGYWLAPLLIALGLIWIVVRSRRWL